MFIRTTGSYHPELRLKRQLEKDANRFKESRGYKTKFIQRHKDDAERAKLVKRMPAPTPKPTTTEE